MRNVRALAVVVGAAAALAACDAAPTRSVSPDQTAASAARLDPMFSRAASEFGVPVELLKAVAFTETGWQFARGEESDMEGLAPAYGIFALRGERLERGAQLAKVSVQAARSDVEASIRAGAALLRAEGQAARVTGSDLGAWAPAVAGFSGIPNEQAKADYVHDGVYRALRQGVSDASQATLAANPAARAVTAAPVDGPSYTAEYGPAIWSPSPNYASGRSGYSTALVVIHTCAGNYSGCWGWLTNTASGVSAHYVVGQTDIGGGVAEVRQLVDEDNTAWHVGKSWQGYPTNPRSIGIEHGGFSYGSNGYGPWPAVQYSTSATLTCDIVKSRGIIRDRDHIIGHYQPDPVNRAHDPGQGFPWADYMSRINSCVGGGTSAAITVDSHVGTGGATARFSASANWISSTGTSGYYGSGYYYASTAAVSDAANFEFYLPAAATKAVSAWWTSGTNRSATAPFIMYNASGTELGRRSVNQQTGGGAWQSLGSYAFSAGWNRVSLSRWTTDGYVVIADAVNIQ
ncbi:MAG TPA: N-acetylmuramoyl-L-alanine amidase [Longimicrobium sp.]|nr:N-acetylmuramoyl-L-alanine amidase [Longimicrobium sp.]